MSESPRSEKCETRYSTPVPELDDHRFQAESLPRAGAVIENMAHRQSIPQVVHPGMGGRPDLRIMHEAVQDGSLKIKDFENAIVDDENSNNDFERFGRRLSATPAAARTSIQRRRRDNQDDSSSVVSSVSSSPPNSVEAFAEPRRRERANTIESHCPTDLEAALHRTVSVGTHNRRPTFSNASAIRVDNGDPRVTVPEDVDVCFPPYEEPTRSSLIDYEELEEFVALRKQTNPYTNRPSRFQEDLVSSSQFLRDLEPKRSGPDGPFIAMRPSFPHDSSTEFGTAEPEKVVEGTRLNEKTVVEELQNENQPNRFSFFSSEFDSTIHASELGDLVLPGDSFRDLFQLEPVGGVWWLDVINPTADEIGAMARAFSIHPLTAEDIITQEAREKVELFKQYYFVCFRTFYQADKSSDDYLEPVNFYMVVFREGVISFSFTENPHAANVRKRIGRLREYVSLSSDWICYAMIDDIVDSFGPLIRDVERESEEIEDHVYIARAEDFSSFLPRIGGLRKKVMSLMRLLGGKADVIKGFSKRCNEQYSVTPRGDIGLYLGDIQDHVVTMMSNLGHFEKMLSRGHANYLAQLNVTNIIVGNKVNQVLSKITLLATVLVPMNLICGLFGMNVTVPGQDQGTLYWFFGILGVIIAILVGFIILARRMKLV